MTAVGTVAYDVPVQAKLVIEIGEDGEHGRREVTVDDLRKFGFLPQHEAYRRFERWVEEVLQLQTEDEPRDITDSVANPLRYAMECATFYDHMPDEDTALGLRRLQIISDVMPQIIEAVRDAEDQQGTIVAQVSNTKLRKILKPVFDVEAAIEQHEQESS